MRRDLGKLRVRQPELIPIHLRFLSEGMNHKLLLATTILWVRTLVKRPEPRRLASGRMPRANRSRRRLSRTARLRSTQFPRIGFASPPRDNRFRRAPPDRFASETPQLRTLRF